MERVRFVEYKGKEILLVDFSNATTEEVMDVIQKAKKVISNQQKNSLFVLADVSGTGAHDKDMAEGGNIESAFREFLEHNRPFVKHSAVVGPDKYKNVFFTRISRITGRSLAVMETREQALEWLSKQE